MGSSFFEVRMTYDFIFFKIVTMKMRWVNFFLVVKVETISSLLLFFVKKKEETYNCRY